MTRRSLSYRPRGPGWVYVLTNPALPGCCKIGGTARTATNRAAELVREYGTAAPFEIANRHAVPDWFAVEQATHRMLADRRVPRSELFEVTPREASRVIRNVALAYCRPWGLTAWLRRLLVPSMTPARAAPPWRRQGTNWIPLLLMLSIAGAAVSITKPVLPPWVPASVAQTMLLLERF